MTEEKSGIDPAKADASLSDLGEKSMDGASRGEDPEKNASIFQPISRDSIKETSDPGSRKLEKAKSKSNRSISLKHSRSYGDGHGYACVRDDNQGSEADETGRSHDEEKDFTVQWDGEDDPMNPRSMHKARKWFIVFIISASSACVCVKSPITILYFTRAHLLQNLYFVHVYVHIRPNHERVYLFHSRCHLRALHFCDGEQFEEHVSAIQC